MYLRIIVILLFLVGMPLLAMSRLGDSARDQLEAGKESGLAWLDSSLENFSAMASDRNRAKPSSRSESDRNSNQQMPISAPVKAERSSSDNYLVLETKDSRVPSLATDASTPELQPAFGHSGKVPTSLVRRDVSAASAKPMIVAPPIAPPVVPAMVSAPADAHPKELDLEVRLYQLGGSHLAWQQLADGTFQYQCRAATRQGLYQFTGVGPSKAIALRSLVEQLSM